MTQGTDLISCCCVDSLEAHVSVTYFLFPNSVDLRDAETPACPAAARSSLEWL
jgi:hypothetical protein